MLKKSERKNYNTYSKTIRIFLNLFLSSGAFIFYSPKTYSEPVCYMNNYRGELIDLTLLCGGESKGLGEEYFAEVIQLIQQNGSPELVEIALGTINTLMQQGELQKEGEKFCAALSDQNSLREALDRQSRIISDSKAEQRHAVELAFHSINSAARTIYCP